MSAWDGDTVITHYEAFARVWLEKVQSQNVTRESDAEGYAEPDTRLSQ